MRLIATMLLTTTLLVLANTETCEAQLFRIRSSRINPAKTNLTNPPLFAKQAGQAGYYIPQDLSKPTVFPREAYFENRNPVVSFLLDGKLTHKYRNPAEVDSRYIGGFHQSHFRNIGVPTGDIGLRGNSFNPRTTP